MGGVLEGCLVIGVRSKIRSVIDTVKFQSDPGSIDADHDEVVGAWGAVRPGLHQVLKLNLQSQVGIQVLTQVGLAHVRI